MFHKGGSWFTRLMAVINDSTLLTRGSSSDLRDSIVFDFADFFMRFMILIEILSLLAYATAPLDRPDLRSVNLLACSTNPASPYQNTAGMTLPRTTFRQLWVWENISDFTVVSGFISRSITKPQRLFTGWLLENKMSVENMGLSLSGKT
jgi:hypothetical protein